MKGLVVYDSVFGNTAEIARAIGAAIGTAMAAPEEVATVKVSDVKPEQLEGLAVLAVGSPTRAFKATPATMAWIRGLPANALHGVKVAAFDTRIAVEDTNSGFLKFMVNIFGYAAKPILGALKKKGGQPVSEPEGFFVKDSEGPLRDGELDRAAAWGKQLVV